MRNLICVIRGNQSAFGRARKTGGRRLAHLLIALVLVAAPSVANAGGIRTLPPVGPDDREHTGYLVVYTATEPVNDGDVMDYTHTDYKLYSSAVFS